MNIINDSPSVQFTVAPGGRRLTTTSLLFGHQTHCQQAFKIRPRVDRTRALHAVETTSGTVSADHPEHIAVRRVEPSTRPSLPPIHTKFYMHKSENINKMMS